MSCSGLVVRNSTGSPLPIVDVVEVTCAEGHLGHHKPCPDGVSLTPVGLGSPRSCARSKDRLEGHNGFSKPTSATLATLLRPFLIKGWFNGSTVLRKIPCKTPAWYQPERFKNQRPFYSSSNAYRRGSCLLLKKPQTNKTNLATFSSQLNFKAQCLIREPLLPFFSTFLSNSPCLKVSSNLKTGQAQLYEQSHDPNCEFYRSWQTSEITPGN